MKTIRIIEVPSELGAGTRGASLGIDALKVAAFNAKNAFFTQFPKTKVSTFNELLYEHSPYRWAKYIDGIEKVFTNIINSVTESINNNEFPLLIAGDHSNAAATIAGLRKAYPNDKIGVIWVDAHADLHTPYTSPTGNMHGMPLAIALGEENLSNRKNPVSDKTAAYWERLKSVGSPTPWIRHEDIVFIAIRDLEFEEVDLINKHSIKNILVEEVRTKGASHTAQKTLALLKDCDRIYLSFDVDSLDSELVADGTGTPVPNGLLPDETTTLLCELLANPKVSCFEVVEINPTLDTQGNKMADVSLQILLKATQQISNRISTVSI